MRLCVGGKYHRFKLRVDDRREAEQFARSKYAELVQQHRRIESGLPGPMLFSEYLKKFENDELPTLSPGTQRSYRDSFKPIREYFKEVLGDPTLDKVRPGHIKEYLAWRRVHPLAEREGQKTVSNRTISKDRSVLHRLFSLAENYEIIEANPVRRTDSMKWDARDPVILDTAQYDKLLEECGHNPMLHLYVLTLGELGVRCNFEALWLRWIDVDLEDGFIWIATGYNGHRTKSGKGRWVPMTPRLTVAMKKHFAGYRFAQYRGKQTEWVFHHTISRRHHKAGARITKMYDGFKAAAARAKLPTTLHQHDLRHRRVTVWLAEGKNAVHVKEAMGHSDLRTTMGYTHLSREHLKDLVVPTQQPDPATLNHAERGA